LQPGHRSIDRQMPDTGATGKRCADRRTDRIPQEFGRPAAGSLPGQSPTDKDPN
jgi:hypothetical protein